ncbi:MAG: chromate efflux transporter [Chloroflexi bacterium]|nr:chromate efflux transporter [Chloroflexota bacterium]
MATGTVQSIAMTTSSSEALPPHESYGRLFLRFLRFGTMAWGGPVAQIGMIRQELVDEEQWISSELFNRVLAVYQVLPGPEAHELCVYFGMQARGRIGGLLAGLGFMLPGFLLMLLLSWVYVTVGISSPLFTGAFYGMQAVVGALIVRAVHRIGGHSLHNNWLWGIALLAFLAQLVGVSFVLTLAAAGGIYILVKRKLITAAVILGILCLLGIVVLGTNTLTVADPASLNDAASTGSGSASESRLFGSGLRSGLLTFGGAYTVIPYLQKDAVIDGTWMTNPQFLDGLALSGILPAPLVIFGTFVGYVGGGFLGAVAVTTGIFLPAFAFTLVGHNVMERLIANTGLHSFLDGVTAGVVGLIAATTLVLLRDAITDLPALVIFGAGLLVLFRWKSKLNVPVVVLAAALAGLLISSL